MTGQVVGDKMDKTVVVKVERKFRHPAFKKIVKVNKKYKVHDEQNQCRVGDVIQISECRPLSKEKRWRLAEIVKKAIIVETRKEK